LAGLNAGWPGETGHSALHPRPPMAVIVLLEKPEPDEAPVKPFKNVTFLLIIAPLEMLPGSAAGHPRELPGIESA